MPNLNTTCNTFSQVFCHLWRGDDLFHLCLPYSSQCPKNVSTSVDPTTVATSSVSNIPWDFFFVDEPYCNSTSHLSWFRFDHVAVKTSFKVVNLRFYSSVFGWTIDQNADIKSPLNSTTTMTCWSHTCSRKSQISCNTRAKKFPTKPVVILSSVVNNASTRSS